MVSVEEAQRRVFDQVTVLPSVEIPTKGALGYIAAAEVKAKDPLPPFPASIKARIFFAKRESLQESGVDLSRTVMPRSTKQLQGNSL